MEEHNELILKFMDKVEVVIEERTRSREVLVNIVNKIDAKTNKKILSCCHVVFYNVFNCIMDRQIHYINCECNSY